MKLPQDLQWLVPVAKEAYKTGLAGIELDDLIQIGALATVEAPPHNPASGATQKTWNWKQAAWAMGQAINRAVRRQKLAPMQRLADEHDAIDSRLGPDELLQHRQCAAALAELPGYQRHLLTLLYAHDLTRADVAREIGGDRWTVRAEEKRALAALRGMMEA